MKLEVIDLRSDTVTKPCAEMLKYMCNTEMGDNFYREDRKTQELEEYCSEYFGKEAALFTISGTMGNQVALRTYIQPGNEIILDASYHINYYEHSSTALLGAAVNLLHTPNGIIHKEDLLQALKNRYRSFLTGKPKLICLENTINYHSGTIYPLTVFQEISFLAKENSLNLYLDGARLLNACIALNTNVQEYTSCVDSLMISFNKGLGAPMGAILLGNKDFIEEARKYQNWYGGGLHQSGIIAAAALFAIKHNVNRLDQDHINAKIFANLLAESSKIQINPSAISTNIVMFSLKSSTTSIETFIQLAKENNILLYPWNHHTIRAVIHKDVNKNQIKEAAYRLLKIISKL